MKKIIALMLMLTLLSTTAHAFNFPEPDWGALLAEKRTMVTSTDFELFVEGSPDNAPYFGAKFEPRSGVYLGMAADYAEGFLPLSSYLTYIESYYQGDLYYPANEMIRQDNVITMVGWTVDSMDNIDYNAIRNTLKNLNAYGKPMLVRFANEMNVSALGNDPDKYVSVFRNVANMIHEYPNLAVVWSPNDMGSLDRPFEYFYPGDEYVDWIGVSCYMEKYFMGNANTAEKDTIYFMTGPYAWATNKVKPIIDFMEKHNIQKPLMLSEGGVTRTASTGEDFTGWHEPRLRNMLWSLIMKYPQIKMINYFNVPRPSETERFDISNFPESVSIFKEAATSGAYLKAVGEEPEFTFTKANDSGTLKADKNGFVNLYTLAYFDKQPDVSVNYKIDGVWVAGPNQIPYSYQLDVNGLTDGQHTLTISSYGVSKNYTLYKQGQYISFGEAPQVPETPITVLVNNRPVAFDQPPVIDNGRTLVPLRKIFEALDAKVDWVPETRTAIAEKDGITISLQIDSTEMKIGNQTKILDVPAKLINGHTLVPARAVSEAFGGTVEWIPSEKTVIIETE